MIVIDGSEGEGGGQVLRTALALSLVTGQAFRIENIRGGRAKPGLMRQHVTAIEAAAAIGGGTVEGVAVGAARIAFRPGRVTPGDYRFAVGTAGSTSLVLQTILPPLMLANGPSRLVLEGGTHNLSAPPFDFIARSFLPVINRMGPRVSARLVRHGFYPAGGGRIEVEIVPAARLAPLDLTDRGAPAGVAARALVAGLPDDIAERELEAARHVLGWPEDAMRLCRLPPERGPGNVIFLEAAFAHVTEVVTGFGQMGVSAHTVGGKAGRRMAGYVASSAFAGPYLADQLLLPMALAGGGRFTTVKPSLHARTAADVIARFLPIAVRFDQPDAGPVQVTVGSSGVAASP